MQSIAQMVFSVIGVGLSMPSLGINAVVLPLVGRLYLDGETGALSVYRALQNYPWSLILQFGSYLLAIGIIIFSWVIWRHANFSRWGVAFYLTGWILFVVPNNQFSRPDLPFIGLLIALGGMTLARDIWIQASLQFTPMTDPTQKADS